MRIAKKERQQQFCDASFEPNQKLNFEIQLENEIFGEVSYSR